MGRKRWEAWFAHLATVRIRISRAEGLAHTYCFYFQKRGVTADFCNTKIMGFLSILGQFFNSLLDTL